MPGRGQSGLPGGGRRALLEVEHIEVFPDRVAFDVRMPDARLRRTTPEIAARAVLARPDLARHACVNPKGRFFGDVIDDTPMPHLLEHLVIDCLVEQSPDEGATYVGTSRWTDARAGRARIEVSLKDDLAVLRAFNRAVALLEEIA